MKLRHLVNFLLICIVVISCNTYDVPPGTPAGIERKIATYALNKDCLQVERFDIFGIKYFKFVDDCVEGYGYLWYDENCNVVCKTINGWAEDSCRIDMGDAVFEEIIWPR